MNAMIERKRQSDIAAIAGRIAEEACTLAECARVDAGLDLYALADILKALADMFQQGSDETRKALDERFNR